MLNQTYRNLEIILIDDGSPDDSGKICDQYAAVDERIRVIHTENRGVSAARNTGIRNSSGDIISFIDADDFIDNDFYSYLLDIMERTASDVTYCALRRIDKEDNPIGTGKDSDITKSFTSKEAIINCLQAREGFGLRIINAIYRKSVIPEFTEERIYAEDQEFIIRTLMNAGNISRGYIAKYNYRLYDSVEKTLDGYIGIENQLETLNNIQKILTDAEADNEVMKAYHDRCMKMDFTIIDKYCTQMKRDKALFRSLRKRLQSDLQNDYPGLKGHLAAWLAGIGEPVYQGVFRFKRMFRAW